MKKFSVLFFLLFAITAATFAQKNFKMNIWPDGFPNSNGTDLAQPANNGSQDFQSSINVTLPEPGKATGRAVLCIPGGGYGMVCNDIEGDNWVPYFINRGIAIIVLKYRLPNGQYSAVPGSDALEAMRIIRRNAKAWNIDPHKVGVMGHSAGGHLAATVATHGVGDARPDFQILFYPVISMNSDLTQIDTHDRLIGQNPSPEMVNYYSMENQVKADNPPAIIFATDNDAVVKPENSVNYYLALHHAGVPASLHIYPDGAHGFSCQEWFKSHNEMLGDLFSWIDMLK